MQIVTPRLGKPDIVHYQAPDSADYDAGPEGFAGDMSTEKYVNLCGVSRATAYRELTALCEMGVLVQTGLGRGTRYRLEQHYPRHPGRSA